jgi:hypothetical protein
MIQWVGVIIALLGLAYNGVKDYQTGSIKIPELTPKKELTKTNYPIQYCLMAYDPNVDKVFYQHENGTWYDYPPQQRRYSPSQEHHQGEARYALGNASGSQGTSGYRVR